MLSAEDFKKLTDRQHVLARTGMYAGSVQPRTQTLYVLNTMEDGVPTMVEREVTITPAICKLFDELLVNATDRVQLDPTCDTIEVSWNKEEGWLSVKNNGHGLPVQVHPEYKEWIPEVVFGNLRAGSNFTENRGTVGGQNGLGAKIVSLLSTSFEVETSDAKSGNKFKGTWKNNMGDYSGAKITKAAKNDYTKITFKPDWSRFPEVTGWTDDLLAWFGKRVVDVAGTCRRKIKVRLNGTLVKVNNWKSYVKLFVDDAIVETIGDRWEIAVATSPTDEFRQMSFVNSIWTSNGGTHVDLLTNQIIKGVLAVFRKRNKGVTIKPSMIRQRMFIFINSLIDNPSFNSQSKEELGSSVKEFGSSPDVPEKFVGRVITKKILEGALEHALFQQQKSINKQDGRKTRKITGIPELDDANFAGTKRSSECTLILTEGLSAKALITSGLGVVGRDLYGSFPLRGKPVNVRAASKKQMLVNAEMNAIVKIMGLKHGVDYKDTSTLRYGRIMIAADQDHDGSHIKGLVANMIQHCWPSLYRMPGFLCQFITPIVRVTKGKQSINFYTQRGYEEWLKENHKGWFTKYLKGLGSSTAADAKEYFSHLDRHVINFFYDGKEDDECMSMVFGKGKDASGQKRTDVRKKWIEEADYDQVVDMDIDEVSYSDFVNKELVLFSHASVIRAIPSLMGLKASQRKVLYGILMKNVVKEEKVAQLAGYISEHTAYHHGEQSLHGTIINMAQNYVGSNNMNLLVPEGQFGSRAANGNDSASPRYIFTRLHEWTPMIYQAADIATLPKSIDDGDEVEPCYMAPIVPIILINGTKGIGTGWSTDVPCFNPKDVIKNILRMLGGGQPEPMIPWYRGFKGTITPDGDGTYKVTGVVVKKSATELSITELPIGVSTLDYKAHLEKMMIEDKIVEYIEHHTDHEVQFDVKLTPIQMAAAVVDPLTYFNLTGSVLTSNMVLLDTKQRPHKYDTPLDILRDYYAIRLGIYEDRRKYLIDRNEEDMENITWKVKFIRLVMGGFELRRPRDVIRKELQDTHKFPDDRVTSVLAMPISSLTTEAVARMEKSYTEIKSVLDKLRSQTPQDIWREDLNALVPLYLAEEKRWLQDIQESRDLARKAKKRAYVPVMFGRPKKRAQRS